MLTMLLLHRTAGIEGARKVILQMVLEATPLRELEEAFVSYEAQLLASGVEMPFTLDLKFPLKKPELYNDDNPLDLPHPDYRPLHLVQDNKPPTPEGERP